MFQNLREEVVRKADVDQEDLHAYRIVRSPSQTAMVVSFATKYPEQFECSKDTVKARGSGLQCYQDVRGMGRRGWPQRAREPDQLRYPSLSDSEDRNQIMSNII